MAAVEPFIVERAGQPYVALRAAVTPSTFASLADRLPQVFGWLGERGVEPAGPPFFRYLVIDADRELLVEAGVPVAAPVPGGGEVLAGELPAGRYVTATHVGGYDGLAASTAALLAWAADRDLTWDVTDTPEGQRWGARLEVLQTSPRFTPDPADWRTDLVFRLAD